jgi:hypothetical protein
VPRANSLDAPELPRLVPLIFHANRRALSIAFAAAALSLYRMFERRSGAPRFADHASLCKAFGIAPGTMVLLTGTDRDPPLERWWGFGGDRRRVIIRAMKAAGVGLVTTPNYSLFALGPGANEVAIFKARLAFQSFRVVRQRDDALWR